MGQLVMDVKQLCGRSHVVFSVASVNGDGSRGVMEGPTSDGWHVVVLFGSRRKAILHWVFVSRHVGMRGWDWFVIVWCEMGAGIDHWFCLGIVGFKSGLIDTKLDCTRCSVELAHISGLV